MAVDYLVCIVRNEALLRKVILVDTDAHVIALLKRICVEFKIEIDDFDLYFSKPTGMTQLMDEEKLDDIGISDSPEARNNFVIIDKPKKGRKQKADKKVVVDNLPKSDVIMDHSRSHVGRNEFENVGSMFSRKGQAAYSGIQNQGSTCYLNCIIQVLYWTPEIRNTVLSWRLPERGGGVDPHKCVLVQFQKLCVKLWLSVELSQSTNMLTRCLGIKSVHTQEDAFEKFNWLICLIESRLNALKIKDTISPLFIGQQESFLKCRECGSKTSKVEDFSGIMLPIKDSITEENFESLEKALRAYCTTEILSDEDMCHCMKCGGLKPMEKQLLFKKLPEILNIVLLRFQSIAGINSKLHHRVEYPKNIVLNQFLSADEPENMYVLHSAIIHSGSADVGHYLCMVRNTENRFIRFNDQKVEWVTDEDFESCFGSKEPGSRLSTKSSYILTYHKYQSKNLSTDMIQLSDVDNEARTVYESYLGDDFKAYVGFTYRKEILYHAIFSNKLATLKEVADLGQRSFPACRGKAVRLVWLNPENLKTLPIIDDRIELHEAIELSPFKNLVFLLQLENDDDFDSDSDNYSRTKRVRTCQSYQKVTYQEKCYFSDDSYDEYDILE